MGRSIFGSNLPPGCTTGDISRAFGDRPEIVEIFKAAHKGKLTPEQEKLLEREELYEDNAICDLIEKLCSWASQCGAESARCDDGMYVDFLEQKHIYPVLFKADEAKLAAENINRLSRWAENADFCNLAE